MTEAHSHAKRLFNATKMVAAYSAHTVCMCLAFVTILPGPSSHATLNGREFVLSPRVYLLSWLFFLLAWLPLLFTKQFRWQYGLSGTVTLGVFQAAFWMWAQVAVRQNSRLRVPPVAALGDWCATAIFVENPALLRPGLLTFLGMVEYHAPAIVCDYFAWKLGSMSLHIPSAVLWIVASIAVPGYMSHYCRSLDPRENFDPFRAMPRVLQGGRAYWHAWGIALAALADSFTGLLLFGVGFLFTSVWFWQVAGLSFATVFSSNSS